MRSDHYARGLSRQLRRFLKGRFNLHGDSADEQTVINNISQSIDFKGTNLWVLMFAIVIASIGLNVNSTAVIIGAMLISPLMGPIMGIGLALGINDFEMLKRAARNFAFAVIISLGVSTLYFLISPILTEQSELLSRTTPSLWDVLIATFGGLAGIVAQTRNDRTSTVIPGVAIATALMPPLCTAGFGLATGNMTYFGGALYLFLINAVFIAISSFVIVRFLKYESKEDLDPKHAKKIRNYMTAIVVLTLVPSVYSAWGLAHRAIYTTNAERFVNQMFVFENSGVLKSDIDYCRKNSTIKVTLFGEYIPEQTIDLIRYQMPEYNLTNTTLEVSQGGAAAINDDQMKSILLSNVDIIAEKNTQIAELQYRLGSLQDTIPISEINNEIKAAWPDMDKFAISRMQMTDNTGEKLAFALITLKKGKTFNDEEKKRFTDWLSARTNTPNIKLIIEE